MRHQKTHYRHSFGTYPFGLRRTFSQATFSIEYWLRLVSGVATTKVVTANSLQPVGLKIAGQASGAKNGGGQCQVKSRGVKLGLGQ